MYYAATLLFLIGRFLPSIMSMIGLNTNTNKKLNRVPPMANVTASGLVIPWILKLVTSVMHRLNPLFSLIQRRMRRLRPRSLKPKRPAIVSSLSAMPQTNAQKPNPAAAADAAVGVNV